MTKRFRRLIAVFTTAITVLGGSALPAMAAPKIAPQGGVTVTTDANLSPEGAYLKDAGTVQLTATISSTQLQHMGTDKLYVFALAPYEYLVNIPAEKSPIASFEAPAITSDGTRVTVTFDLPQNGLYMKYVLASFNGSGSAAGTYSNLVGPQGGGYYISNPELLAGNTKARVAYPAKAPEGIFANYNIDTKQASPSYFSGSAKIVQFNNYGNNPTLVNPRARLQDIHAPWAYDVDKQPFQYMLNAADMNGITAMANIMHEVAANGPGQDYIIGNEVNVRKWAYMAYASDKAGDRNADNQYVREYMQVFRVAYNAIKSADANARVFICMDQNWDRNHPASYWEHYCVIDVKDFLDMFNEQIMMEGNIDWCMAFHPHPVPLTYAKFWANSADYTRLVNQNKMVTVQNLSVVTDYLSQPGFLNTKGQPRAVIATEVGFSANQGEDVQGAAVYAAYAAVVRNPVVETIVINQDPQPNINSIFSPKAAEVYANMDGANGAAYDAWAKSVIGISDWGQILR